MQGVVTVKFHSSIAEEARIAMSGRILRCPIDDNPEDCPLHEIRKIPLEERIAWLDSKSDEEVVDLYRRHVKCLRRKISEDPRFR